LKLRGDIVSNDFRTVPRYFITNGLPAMLDELEVSVVDLSIKGARLQLTMPVPVGSTVPLVIWGCGRTVTTQATILWSQLVALSLNDEENDRHLCGVMFENIIPVVSEIVDDLLASGDALSIQDERGVERYRITAPITANFGEIALVRMLDLSVRGARIGTRNEIPVGTQAVLRFRLGPKEATVEVFGTVMWSKPAERRGGFESGMRVEGEEALLRATIAQLCMHNHARIDLNSLRRKFDPLRVANSPGLVALVG